MEKILKADPELEKGLQSLWSIEDQLVQTLPMLSKKAATLGLQKTLAHHFAETTQHRVAIEAMCKELGLDPKGQEDTGLKNLLQEGQAQMQGKTDKDLDAAIIKGCIQVEEYELAAYQKISAHARSLGLTGMGQRLRLTMEEENQSRTKLEFLQKNLDLAKWPQATAGA